MHDRYSGSDPAEMSCIVEGVDEVVLGLDRRLSVGVIAIRLSNATGVVVGIEEVDIDAPCAMRLEGFEEPARPPVSSTARSPAWSGSHTASMTRLWATSRASSAVPLGRNSGDGATHVEHRRVRPGRVDDIGMIGDDSDRVVGETVEVRRLPVMVPAVEDGVIHAALEGGVGRGCEQVNERGPEPTEGLERRLPSSTAPA